MTGSDDAAGTDAAVEPPRKRATLRTHHDDAATVAAALAPDNTDRMRTRVEGDHVVTRIERESAGGLRSTVDDYVVNLRVADSVGAAARHTRNADRSTTDSTARTTDSDSTTHDTDDT